MQHIIFSVCITADCLIFVIIIIGLYLDFIILLCCSVICFTRSRSGCACFTSLLLLLSSLLALFIDIFHWLYFRGSSTISTWLYNFCSICSDWVLMYRMSNVVSHILCSSSRLYCIVYSFMCFHIYIYFPVVFAIICIVITYYICIFTCIAMFLFHRSNESRVICICRGIWQCTLFTVDVVNTIIKITAMTVWLLFTLSNLWQYDRTKSAIAQPSCTCCTCCFMFIFTWSWIR